MLQIRGEIFLITPHARSLRAKIVIKMMIIYDDDCPSNDHYLYLVLLRDSVLLLHRHKSNTQEVRFIKI